MGSERLSTLTAVAVLLLLILLLQKSKVVKSKECTNIPPQLSSHSYRAALLLGSENNSSWKWKWKQKQQQLYVLLKRLQYNDANTIHDLMHNLAPDDGEQENQAWSSFLPMSWAGQYKDAVSSHNRIEEYDWRVVYRNIKRGLKKFHAASNDNFLQEVSLHDVDLDPDSMHGRAQRTNLEYLLMLDVDRLVWSFRTTAGLPALGMPYGGWESNTSELRGHFVGHYLSATAKLWASTHNLTVQERMKSVVDALHQCQAAMATGYLSAFPSEFFDRFEAIKPVWAPYYTIHKIMNGLLDQYTYAGNELAFNMTLWMADYFYNRVQNVIQKFTIERHWYSLNEETGGMNDVLYRLYMLSGNQKHLVLAHLFDKPCFLGLLAVKTDSISGFHANTHIPIVIGAQMRYEVTGDSLYKDISTFFMDIVNSSHAYATGGTSVGEFWSDPKRLADTLGRENEESCTTYNMLKVARSLFRWSKSMEFADYYERALTNGVLSIQRGTDPGVMIYMLPQAPGVSKARTYHGWGTKFDSFWCCYGTGVESFSKLGDSIYFLEESSSPSLYVIQFVSSTLNWAAAGLSLKQVVNLPSSWNANMHVTMQFSSNQISQTGQENEALVNVRVPFWTRNAKALLNTEELELPTEGNFLTIKRGWKSGDKISLSFPVELRTEKISDDRPWTQTIQAILFGPYLLAGMTDGEWDLIITEKSSSLSDWITSIPEEFATQLFTFGQQVKQESGDNTFVMAHSNGTVIMNRLPEEGTNEALQATFRVIDSTSDEKSGKPDSIKDYVGKNVYLELFNRPRVFVTHRGINNNVGVSMRTDEGFDTDKSESDSKFKVVQGLDGNEDSISFESVNFPNCYLVSQGGDGDAEAVQLRCKVTKREVRLGLGLEFDEAAASFRATSGLATFHPMSFIVKGSNRHYLLAPLLTFRDETYTIYFNITTTASAH